MFGVQEFYILQGGRAVRKRHWRHSCKSVSVLQRPVMVTVEAKKVAHQTSAKSSSLIFIINSSGIPLRHPSATPTDKLCYAFTGRQTLCMRRWQTDMSLYVGCVRAARIASMTVRTNTSASVFVCVSRPARGHEAYCTRGPTRTRMQFVPLKSAPLLLDSVLWFTETYQPTVLEIVSCRGSVYISWWRASWLTMNDATVRSQNDELTTKS